MKPRPGVGEWSIHTQETKCIFLSSHPKWNIYDFKKPLLSRSQLISSVQEFCSPSASASSRSATLFGMWIHSMKKGTVGVSGISGCPHTCYQHYLIVNQPARFSCTSLFQYSQWKCWERFCRISVGPATIAGVQTSSALAWVCCHVKQSKWVHVLTSPVPLLIPLYRKSRLLSSAVGWKSWNSSGFFCAGVMCRSLSLPALPVRWELLRVLSTAVICRSF